MQTRLLGSSPTLAGIEKVINTFYASENYKVCPYSLAVTNATRCVPDGIRVVKFGRGYRFERIVK